VIEAVTCVRRLGLFTIFTIGLMGASRLSDQWGVLILRGLVDTMIAVPADETPRVQECHIPPGRWKRRWT
jgi:phosphoheptose isomerase